MDFANLDLSNVQEAGPRTLRPGIHQCKIVEAKVEPTRGGGTRVAVKFEGTHEPGFVYDFINIHLPGKNPRAEEIGRERLKSLLVAAGHPNPNRPGDIRSLLGLQLMVNVEQGEDYRDQRTGEVRRGGGQVVEKNGDVPYSKIESGIESSPSTQAYAAASAPQPQPQPGGQGFGDNIPF